MAKPKIAVMLDENTSKGGQAYELNKSYIHAVAQKGGLPYCIPYVADFVDGAVREFDGFFAVGGSVKLPQEWYMAGQTSPYPPSERTEIEAAMMIAFLQADKPVFGSCNGMQIMAGLHGCTLRADLGDTHRVTHEVDIIQDTRLAGIIGAGRLSVNSRHSECVAAVSRQVAVNARGSDGIIEGIEIPGKRFAIGLQWHQEDFWRDNHPGNAVFAAFIGACA